MSDYTDEQLLEIWYKGHILPTHNPKDYRRDDFGNTICFTKYGKTDLDYGWEVDHIRPVSEGGSDHIDNLRPLQWEANRNR